MKRYAQVIQLHPDKRQAYIDQHQSVWPAVLATISRCNIKNYSIFLYQNLVFAYFEYHGSDYHADMLKMAECPSTQKWWSDITDPMLISVVDSPELSVDSPGMLWKQLPEVFHYEG